jgi:hypothetical protein
MWIKLVEFTWRIDVVKHKHLVVFTSLLIYVFVLSLLNITYSFSSCVRKHHIRSLHMVWCLLR